VENKEHRHGTGKRDLPQAHPLETEPHPDKVETSAWFDEAAGGSTRQRREQERNGESIRRSHGTRLLPGTRRIVQLSGSTIVRSIADSQPVAHRAMIVTCPRVSPAMNRTRIWLPLAGLRRPVPVEMDQEAGPGLMDRQTVSSTAIRVRERFVGH
jgi:hypothetical protein